MKYTLSNPKSGRRCGALATTALVLLSLSVAMVASPIAGAAQAGIEKTGTGSAGTPQPGAAPAGVERAESGPGTVASAVQEVVEAFYRAAAAGDVAAAGRLTHVDAKLFGASHDKLMQTPLTLWPARSGVDMDTVRIGPARVAGTAAVVEVRRLARGQHLVEQVSLVRFNGAWRVMSIVQGIDGN